MWIVFLLFLFVLGIIFSKIKVNIEKIKLDTKGFDFKIKLDFLWFGILKILKLEFNEVGIKFLKKQIKYNRLISESKLEKIKKDFKFDIKKIEGIEKLKPKIELIKFNLKVGTEDIFITTFLVTVVSVLITEFFRRKIKKLDFEKTYYRVLPEFNKNVIYYEGKILIGIKTMNIFKVLRQ